MINVIFEEKHTCFHLIFFIHIFPYRLVIIIVAIRLYLNHRISRINVIFLVRGPIQCYKPFVFHFLIFYKTIKLLIHISLSLFICI